jgi:N-acetyl-gamma-glutamylphosphate reductase
MSISAHLRHTQEDKTEEVLAFRSLRGEPFVRICPKGKLPNTRNVKGSNYCDIGVVSGGEGRLVIVTAIDNLVKGASGQAVQNMNIMLVSKQWDLSGAPLTVSLTMYVSR